MTAAASRGRWQIPLALFVGLFALVTIAWTVIESLYF